MAVTAAQSIGALRQPLSSLAPFSLPPSLPAPLPSLRAAKRPQEQQVWGEIELPHGVLGRAPAAKHILYILRPEIVSAGNDFCLF